MFIAVGYADPDGGIPFSQKKSSQELVKKFKMNFEINGINFENKGSWLMLLSIEKKLKDNFKNPKISLTCRSFKDYNKIQNYLL